MTAYLNALGVLCALGRGKAEVAARLLSGDASGMQPYPQPVAGRQLPVGAVPGELPALPFQDLYYQTRNNQLLLAAAQEIEPQIRAATARYGAGRVGVVLGTSTTGIQESSQGIAGLIQHGQLPDDYHYGHQELSAPAVSVRWRLPANACAIRFRSTATASTSARPPHCF